MESIPTDGGIIAVILGLLGYLGRLIWKHRRQLAKAAEAVVTDGIEDGNTNLTELVKVAVEHALSASIERADRLESELAEVRAELAVMRTDALTTLTERDARIAELKHQVNVLETRVAEQDAEIAQLRALNSELSRPASPIHDELLGGGA